jgi:PPP family 3-phenylpropionic acid transporter
VVSEVLLLAVGGTWLRRATPMTIMGLGAATSIVRWTALGFDPPLAVLVPLQILHGFTFGATMLGAIQFMSRAVPDSHAGTSQGLYGVFAAGIGGAGGAWLAGIGYQAFGGPAYWLMAVLAGLGAVGVTVVARRWHGQILTLAAR